MGNTTKYSTDQRKALLDFFKCNLHEAFSVRQLEEKLQQKQISKSAIYRNIAMMEQEGQLCPVTGANSREKLYQYVDPDCCAGVVHLICGRCSATHHLDRNVSGMLFGMAFDNFGFTIDKQKAVIYGLCENCSQINMDEEKI